MRFLLLLFIAIAFLQGCDQHSHQPIDLNTSPADAGLFAQGLIATPLYERDLAISPAGDEIIYTLGDYTQKHRFLVSIHKGPDGWGERKILSFSGTYQDIEPFFSMDGKKLFFASNRPMPGDTAAGDYNIWVSKRKAAEWGDPIALDSLINTPGDEFYPAVAKNGNLYFTATRTNGVGTEDIFISQNVDGQYQKPVPLDTAINSKTYEYNAWISPDEDIIIFGSYGRADGLGGGDLYISKKRADDTWEKARNMGRGINTEALDFCPFVDLERGSLYFTSTRTKKYPEKVAAVDTLVQRANGVLNGLGNIYQIELSKAGL